MRNKELHSVRRRREIYITERKTQHLISRLIALTPSLAITQLSDEELRQSVIRDKYEQAAKHTEVYKARRYEDADETTMRRWIVQYIRHNLVDYSPLRRLYTGKIGTLNAYPEFKTAVLKRVAEVYPDYADECEIQIERCKALAEWRQQ